MANFKKGIALALVATTAFTFAPVANLGTPVVAEAAHAQFTSSSINLTTGSTTTYNLDQPAGVADDAPVVFRTSDNTVAIVTVGGTPVNTADTENGTDAKKLDRTWAQLAQNGDIVIEAGTPGKSAKVTVEYVNVLGNKETRELVVNSKALSSTPAYIGFTPATDGHATINGNVTVRKGAAGLANVPVTVPHADDGTTFDITGITSSNTSVATVDYTAATVDGENNPIPAAAKVKEVKGVGTTTITVSTLSVNEADPTKANKAADYKFNLTVIPEKSTFKIGTTEVLTATANATNPTSVLYLTGSNPSKAIGATLTDAAPGEELEYKCYKANLNDETTDITVKNDVVTANANAIDSGAAYYVVVSIKGDSHKKAVVKVVTERAEKEFASLSVNLEGKDYKAESAYKVNNGNLVYDDAKNEDAKLTLSTNDKKSVPFTVTSNSTNGWEVKSSDENTVAVVGNDIVGKKLGSATLTFTNKSDTTHHGSATVVVNVSVTTQLLDAKVVAENETINLNKVTKSAKIAASVVATPALAKQPELTYEFVTKNADGTYTKASSTDLSLAKDGTVTYTTDKTGEAIVAISAPATNEYAAPKTAYVTVKYTSAKAAAKLAVATKSVNVVAGETSALVATGTALTFKSSDETVATVAADGTVTGVKAGVAVITVTDAGDENTEGASIDVPVYVTAKAAPVVIAKPAKVTSLKVAYVGGNTVKVSFKKSAKATGYLVTYKVGNKTVKKTTTKTALTLSVKKGAKVKVSVKAFNKNAAGAKQYSAAVTKTLKIAKK
ncbi:hypothetical protein SAMN05216391_1421 [Lachnospiraceae bacterium KHCPX20]|nr:hypothetical protein SAMN05216391_1421 [Lachnospiraceae bacterium KHCPX20]